MSLAWGGHSNGRIPASALMRVPWAPTHWLEAAACESLIAVNVAYRARFGRDLPLTDSYRPYDVQERIFRQRYVLGVPQGTGDVRRFEGGLWYLRRGQASAAVPGTSNHGWAKAIDAGVPVNIFGTTEHLWMRQWADDAGWVHPAWAHDGTSVGGTDEPWHFEYPSVVRVTRPIGPSIPTAPSTPTPVGTVPAPLTPLTPEDDDMYDERAEARLMARLQAVLDEAAGARSEAAAARTEAATASARAASALQTAQLAVQLAGDAASISGELLQLAADGRGIDAQRHTELLRAQRNVLLRMPRATSATYGRTGVRTYAELAERAADDGLTYASMSAPRALIGG